ncbi:carboxypeptidase regulatory-like domain-containing protein [Halalkalicoccus salilacus]|uniref:carboxypeptidase regulatory-like domain-containing protein n=1 Tax=Halalkalicoccus salilacus TaxID=3117459 RepID=UPI00300F587E
MNDTTDDPAEANDTTNDSEGADQPDAEDGGEMNESDPDADASPTPETDETDEADGTSEDEGTDQTDESDESDETGQTDQTDQTDETDGTDGAEESTETDGSDQTDENDGADESDGTQEYASPDDIRVEGVTHMESQADLESDEITVSNTNDELPLPIGGWEIAFEEGEQRITIEEGTVIEPGETRTIQLGEGEKVLNETGGIVHLYDAEGNHVGSWDHIGSPSGPPEADDGGEVGYVQFEVVDAESGEGIEDAEVTLEGEDDRFTGSTDGAGVTTIREIPYGEYELTVEHDQYTSHSDTITVDENGTEMTVEMDPSESEEAATRTSTPGTVHASA